MNLAWARLLLGSLRAAGAGELVVSPGSRSTPLVLAAAELGWAAHVIIDERAAGFAALAMGKVSGRPSVLLCTSGSAAGHYLPAVIEAAEAETPLLVVSADRPPELHGGGASQTIDQTRLFGDFARGFVDLGAPIATVAAARGLARRAAQVVTLALGPRPGPVHLNVPLRKPLEPTTPPGPDDAAMARAAAVAAAELTVLHPARARASAEGVAALVAALDQARRPLFVAGPASLAQAAARPAIFALLARLGAPLLAEAASQLGPGLDAPAAVLRAWVPLLAAPAGRARLAPDLVIQLGRPPVAREWAAAQRARAGVPRVVLCERGWPDPDGDARLIVHGELGELALALAARVGPPPDRAWLAEIVALDDAAARATERALARGDDDGLAEPAAVRAVLAGAPPGSLVVVGNSLPIRMLDRLARRERLAVLSQRGVAGIDGLVAGSFGAALVAGRPVLALLGDVSLAHDAGSLALLRALRSPLCLAVIDNGGGRIFDELPVARLGRDEVFRSCFTTPPGLAVAAVARGFGLEAHAPAGLAAVTREVAAALERPRATVLELGVGPHSAAAFSTRLAAAVAHEVAA